MRPVGSTRPRAYGLPKIHKPRPIPVRHIISMSGSPQYAISKWLADLLQPVLKKYSCHCVRDSFDFSTIIKETKIIPGAVMCSYDVVSLLTSVPLAEVIDICADTLYRDSDSRYLLQIKDSVLFSVHDHRSESWMLCEIRMRSSSALRSFGVRVWSSVWSSDSTKMPFCFFKNCSKHGFL